jgi:tRNA-dihydrouridine synthase B
MKIGAIVLEHDTVLAPLAGITNLAFRLLVKAYGCGLVCSEMISACGLVYGSAKTRQLLDSVPAEKPLSVQLFGSDPAIMADAAAQVAASGADIVDINFGCSVKKILKSGSGAALMRAPERAEAILKAVRGAVDIPLTIKIRSGWEPGGCQAFDIAAIAQDCGVDAIAFHPRSATQGFRGQADWDLIAQLKKRVTVPVIGNGDVVCATDALAMKARTGCDAVMIGRAAIGAPWIFSQILALDIGEPVMEPDIETRLDTMVRYLQASVRCLGEATACRMMRSRLSWFAKAMAFSSHFRESIKHIETEAQALACIASYRQRLQGL